MKRKTPLNDKYSPEQLAKLGVSQEPVIIKDPTAPRKRPPKPEAWANSRKPPGGKLPDWD